VRARSKKCERISKESGTKKPAPGDPCRRRCRPQHREPFNRLLRAGARTAELKSDGRRTFLKTWLTNVAGAAIYGGEICHPPFKISSSGMKVTADGN
jgi:hypothetical protein